MAMIHNVADAAMAATTCVTMYGIASTQPWNSVAWTSACSASRVLRMFSRMRRKKPRRCCSRSASSTGGGAPLFVMKRSYQSRATGAVRIER